MFKLDCLSFVSLASFIPRLRCLGRAQSSHLELQSTGHCAQISTSGACLKLDGWKSFSQKSSQWMKLFLSFFFFSFSLFLLFSFFLSPLCPTTLESSDPCQLRRHCPVGGSQQIGRALKQNTHFDPPSTFVASAESLHVLRYSGQTQGAWSEKRHNINVSVLNAFGM